MHKSTLEYVPVFSYFRKLAVLNTDNVSTTVPLWELQRNSNAKLPINAGGRLRPELRLQSLKLLTSALTFPPRSSIIVPAGLLLTSDYERCAVLLNAGWLAVSAGRVLLPFRQRKRAGRNRPSPPGAFRSWPRSSVENLRNFKDGFGYS